MGEFLCYRYTPGQSLTYEQTQSMLFTDPDRGKAAGRSVTLSVQRVIENHPDSSWTIELKQQVTGREGVLDNDLAADLMSRPIQYRINARGAMVDPSGALIPGSSQTFPLHAVEVGESWRPEGDQLGVVFTLRSYEDKGNDLVANLESTMAIENSDDSSRTTCESTFSFSITRGCHLGSTSVTETTWPDGRMVQSVIESRLVEPAQT